MNRTKAAPIQVQKYLKGVKYPASKEDLVKCAQQNKADKDIISLLQGMQADKFNSPAEVSKAIGDED